MLKDYNLISSGVKRDKIFVEIDLTALDDTATAAKRFYSTIPKQLSVNDTATVSTV